MFINKDILWSLVQLLSKQGISVAVLFILSFFISPNEFGIFSLSVSVFLFLSLIADTGLNAAVIQKQNISEIQLNTVYFLNIFISIGLFFIAIGVAIPFANFYQTPGLALIISILSIGLIFTAISSTHTALLQKSLAFKTLTLRDILAVLSGGVIALIALYFNAGVWTLVAQSLAISIVSALSLQYLSTWKADRTLFDLSSIRELLPYSKHIFGFNIIKYFAQNLDLLFIGYFLGPKAIGLYAFFYKIIIVPFAMLSGAVGNYIFAKYARKEAITVLKKNFFSLLVKQNAILIPLVILVGIGLSTVLRYDLMPQWKEGISIIPFMIFIVAIQITVSPMGNLLKAIGSSNYLFYWSLLLLIEICSGFITIYYFDTISIKNVLIVIGVSYSINSIVMFFMIQNAFKKLEKESLP